MWGIGLALALVASGVAFIVLGLQAQADDEQVQAAVLFKWFVDGGATSETFVNCSGFSFAMDAPEYTSFYLWNLTNAEALLAGGNAVQPKLQQVGPYTYEKRSRKLNVNFHPIQGGAYSLEAYGAVSYQVASTYHFSSERSNGSETDAVVTLNATYVRHLTKLHAQTGRSERFLVAEFAHAYIRDYTRHLQSDFLAASKLRALRALLPDMVSTVKREGLAAVVNRQRKRVGDAGLSAALVRMHAVARTEQIPVMLRDVFRDQADMTLSDLLTKQFALARRQAVPRVISNMYNRLVVEAVPALLGRQMETQFINFVPRTLSSLNLKMQRIAFPYVLQEVFERACLEVVPFVLRTIKMKIVELNMVNQVTADQANLVVVNLWRQLGSTPTDFDAWIDDSSTGDPRTGFELLPATSALQLSLEAATILLGSLSSNLRFSLVDYDAAQTAVGLNAAQTTAVGFAIWKKVVALDETAITSVLDGVNNDVASPADYLTRNQLLAVRDYIITWAQSSTIQRDRQRFWRKAFAKRTASVDLNDPDVDLDVERTGVQSGFSLQPLTSPPSATTVSADVAQQLWNASIEFAFIHPVGFTKWMRVIDGEATALSSGLLVGVTGMTNSEAVVVSTWIKSLLDDGFVRRRALLHWATGTCVTALQIPRQGGCLRYDLEPNVAGDQFGFEMNPNAVLGIGSGISESARNALWDVTQDAVSFLMAAHPSETTKYYARWLQAIRTNNYKRLIDESVPLTTLALTEVSAQAIGAWLDSWVLNNLNKLVVYNWWVRSSCWPRDQISKVVVGTPTVTSGLSECTEPTPTELEQSTAPTAATESPFFTDTRVYQVTEDTCAASGSQFTRTRTTFTLTASVFSCDVVSTGLADDVDDGTRGFELGPLVRNSVDRISLAAAIVLWNPENKVSFRTAVGYQRWMILAAHISASAVSVSTEVQGVVNEVNAAITLVCQQGINGGGASSAIFNSTMITTSCTQVTTNHVTRIAAWVNAQSGSTWVRNTLLDQWRRGLAGKLDIEPYRDGLQSGLELTTGCETSLVSLTAAECSSITTESNTKYKVPREALRLWGTSHEASFLTPKGYALWDSLASAVESQDATSVDTTQKALAKLCGSAGAFSVWESWMGRVFQWLQRWKTNEHLQRDVLGHWLYARCPTTPTTISVTSEPPPQTSVVSSCTPAYTFTLSSSLDDIQQLASRPVTFFDANVVQGAALIRPTKTVTMTEAWTKCAPSAGPSFTKTVETRQSTKRYEACNLLRVLATPDVDPSEVTPLDANFELNRSTTAGISLEVAQEIWDAQSDFTLLDSTTFLTKWYPAIDRSNALQEVQSDLNSLLGGSSTSDLTFVQRYLKQWEISDAAASSVATLWVSTKPASVDVDIHQDDDQRGFELYWSDAYKGSTTSFVLPTLQQAKSLWNSDSVYSIVRSDSNVDNAGLPTGFRAWEEMYEGVDYESERLVSQYPLQSQVTRSSTMTHTLSAQKRAQLLSAITTETSLSEAQVCGIARWLLGWAADDSLHDFVLSQWATGETYRGDSKLSLDLAAHLQRLYGFSLSAGMDQHHFTAASSILATASRTSLKTLWDIATTGSLLDPASRIAWCVIDVTDSDGNGRAPCAHLLNGYGVLEDAAFEEFVALVQPTIPNTSIVQETADLSALAIGFLEQALGLTSRHVQVVAKWYRGVPESSLFFQVHQLDEWSKAASQPSADPLQFAFALAFVLPWNASVPRNVSTKDLVPNVAVVEASKVEKSVGQCTASLSLLYTVWDSSNPVSFLHPTGLLLWLSYARGEIDEKVLVAGDSSPNPTGKVIDEQKLADATISCLFQQVGHWLKSWSNHPSARMFVEEFWIAPITQGATSTAALLPSATDMTTAFLLQELNAQQGNQLFSATDWWAATARIILDTKESVALINVEEGFALWQTLLIDCFSSERTTGKCKAPEELAKAQATKAQAMKVLSRALVDRIVNVSSVLSGANDEALLKYTLSMIQSQLTPWLIGLLDHSVLEQYVLDRVRSANGDTDVNTGPKHFVDLAAVQFVKGSVTAANYVVRDSTTGTLLLKDDGRPSERFPREEFVFDDVHGTIEQRTSEFLPGFSEIGAFCSKSGQDRQFAYDAEVSCGFGTSYTLSSSDAKVLWSAFGFEDTTLWTWPKVVSSSDVPAPTALPTAFRRAVLLDAFLAQPFKTTEECEALMVDVNKAFTSAWSDQEKQKLCVNRSGQPGVGPNAVYLLLAPLEALNDKHISFVHDMQAYLRHVATKFGYEPKVLGLPPRPPREEDAALSSSLNYPTGGYFASLLVSQILFASPPSQASEFLGETPLWPNATTTERGASSFELVVPLKDDLALFRKSKSSVGRLLSIDNKTLMNAWGEGVELNTVRLTDSSQFTTAVLLGLGEDAAGLIELPPQKLYFYWPYARRVAQITFDSNITRFGISMMRYEVDWSLPTQLPTGLVPSTSPPTPSLNMSFLTDDLPLVLQKSSASQSPTSVMDIDPQTGVVLHRRLVWQLTAAIGEDKNRQVLDVWHDALPAGWLPIVWIEEEAGVSVATSASMTNRGPLTAKTLSVLGIVGGSSVIVVGCVVAYVSIRRARVIRLQRFHSIVPEASTADVVNGDDDALKGAVEGGDTGRVEEVADAVMQTMLDETEGIEGAKGEGEIRTEATTRAWLHRSSA